MKRKLFLITDSFPYGAGESFVLTELRHLNRWYDITVVPRFQTAGEPRLLPEGVKVQTIARHSTFWEKIRFTCGFVFGPQGRREWAAILRSGEKRMQRLLTSLKYYIFSELFWCEWKEKGLAVQSEEAVLYSFWYTAAAMGLGAHRKEMPGCRVVVRTHGYDLYNERMPCGRQPFKPAADAGMDRVISCCRLGKEYYRNTFHTEENSKYVVIPLGTDDGGNSIFNAGSGALRLISCASAIPLKRIERIIEGLALLPKDVPVEWTHIGGGPLLESLRIMAEGKLQCLENITYNFMGHVDNTRVHELYQAGKWDAFITTSSTEGSPISVQEAISYGLPVIATAVGGIPELLEGTDNVLLPADPSPQEIADGIRLLSGVSPEKWKAMKEANRRHWETHYCAANNARRMMEMMEELWCDE